ncbi:MAG: RidA family protein [Nitrospirae bacterium]|nr:MAG: RidA family protein [Nitrospirota bacterium]
MIVAGGCVSHDRGRHGGDAPITTSTAKQTASLGLPWENEFGYAQGVKAGPVIYVAGQMSLDDTGAVMGTGNTETQMRQAYANVRKVLSQFNAEMEDVLEETLYVTDMLAALTAASKVRREVYPGQPAVASTIVQVQRLALKDALVEIRVTARAQQAASARPYVEQQSQPSGRRGGGRGGGMGGGGPR